MAEFKGMHRLPERKWEVVVDTGEGFEVEAHYGFNNGAEGLVFRSYNQHDDKTHIVAAFSQGCWKRYREIKS